MLRYIVKTPLVPCLSSIATELKRRKASLLVHLQQSPDMKVSENVLTLYSGKWNANDAVEAARPRIRLVKIGGKIRKGRCGLGYGKVCQSFRRN